MRYTKSGRLNMPTARLLALPSLFAVTLALASPAVAALLSPARSARPAVEVCGQGPALTRPGSIILTCADHDTIAEHLRWSSWTATRATATGTITWRACLAGCGQSQKWDRATADIALTHPARERGKRILFTRLGLHVTGPTPPGFMRNAVFSEAPAPPVPVAPASPARRPGTTLPPRSPLAPSGTLGYAQIEGFWIDAGGPSGSDGSYTFPQVAAAITGAESSFRPGVIQPDEPYSTTGWGLWQITPGNSVSQYGTDFQVLDPWNNAEEAVYKYNAAGGFSPWTTYLDGAYTDFLETTSAATELTDPGQYVQVNPAPSGTPSSPAAGPGSTDGPPMAAAYAFWPGTGSSYDLWEAQGAAVSGLSGPTDRGYGALGSAPGVGVDGNGYTYVYWEGSGSSHDLWEAYWDGSGWAGPFDRGMGPLASQPAVAVTRSGTAYVFWKGANGDLWEAQGPADGALSGPTDRGYGTLGSAPAAGVDSSGATYVYWEGSGSSHDLWEAYWDGSGWAGPFDRGMGPLASQPSVAITPDATAYVFWEGTGPADDLWEAQGPADGALSGPTDRGMGPLGSAPTAGVDGFGNTFVYWKGTGPADDLWEAYWNGSGWAGPFNRGMGPLNSAPAVAIYSYTTG